MEPQEVQRVNEWHRERRNELAELVGSAVLPIVLENTKDRPEIIGSSVLLRVAEEVFLITAGHVIDFVSHGPLYLGTQGRFLSLSQGDDAINSVPPGRREDDPFDIAVLRLTGEALAGVQDRQLFSLDQVDPDEVCAPDTIYIALGYPLSKVKVRAPERHATAPGISITGGSKPNASLRPGRRVPVNLAMALDRERMFVGENFQTGTHPRGMSGGALIRFESLRHHLTAHEDRLVGILIEYQEMNKVIVATNIAIPLEMIRERFPNLSPLIPKSRVVRVNVEDSNPHVNPQIQGPTNS